MTNNHPVFVIGCKILTNFINLLMILVNIEDLLTNHLPLFVVGCGIPGKPNRGYRVGNDFSTGATVEYFCDSGLRMVSGSRLRTCNEHGKWSGTLPRCRGKCLFIIKKK